MTEATKLCLIGDQKWSQTSISASCRRTKSFAWKIDFLVHKTTFPWINVLFAIPSSLDSFATCSITRIFLSSGQSWCFTFSNFVTNLEIILFDNLSVYSRLFFTLHENKKEITWSMTSLCIRSCSCCSLLRLLRRPLSLGDAGHNNEVEIMSWRNRILIMAIIVKVFFTSNLELCVAVACPVDKLLQRWEHYNAFFTICWSQPFTIGSSWSLGQSRPAGGKA